MQVVLGYVVVEELLHLEVGSIKKMKVEKFKTL